MENHNEALSRLVDEFQAKADKAYARGQFKAAAKHQAKVGAFLAKMD